MKAYRRFSSDPLFLRQGIVSLIELGGHISGPSQFRIGNRQSAVCLNQSSIDFCPLDFTKDTPIMR